MDFFVDLLDAQITFGTDNHILWREVVGNLFGLASAVGGMRRQVWAWPVGIVGNVLLFTVFLGGVFNTPQAVDLYGQAGRQIFFIAVSVYGFVRWRQAKRDRAGAAADVPAIVPRWATRNERIGILVAAAAGTVVFSQIFGAIGSYGQWADAWIFTGSVLATYGMARGWTEFWLIWVGVDIVGVPLLLKAGFYPSAILYAVYGGFVIWGFFVWMRAQRDEQPTAATAESPVVETLG
ncbi:MAG: nicotinamide mononucleotide transporter [Sporichthyaceae bacterium]|nr:nicotinamide mononucleotide transporter [Sporichthyaceae bacterium]